MSKRIAFRSLLIATGLFLGACGGSDAPATSNNNNNDNNTGTGSAGKHATVSGVASAGAAMSGIVNLKDSKGTEVHATIGSGGTFSVSGDNLVAPFLLEAVPASGSTQYSFASAGGTTNINPFTTVLVSSAAHSTNLNGLYATGFIVGSTATGIESGIPTAKTLLNTNLASLYAEYSLTDVDFLNGSIAIGQGVDVIFDSVGVRVGSGEVTLTNQDGGVFLSITVPAQGSPSYDLNSDNLPSYTAACVGTTCTCGGSDTCIFDACNATTSGCVFTCTDTSSCTGVCGADCTAACSGTACQVTAGSNSTVACTGTACTVNAGAGSSVTCSGTACTVNAGANTQLTCSSGGCSLTCTGPCLVVGAIPTCTNGTTLYTIVDGVDYQCQ